MLLQLFEDNTDELDQTCLCRVLVHLICTRNVDVVEGAHYLEQALLVYFCGACGHKSQQGTHNLQLNLLVTLCRAGADFVHDGVNEASWEHPVALRLGFIWIQTVIWVVAIQKTVCHELLDVVEYLLCKAWNLRIHGQLHDSEVFVGTQRGLTLVRLDLLDRLPAQVLELFALLGQTLAYLLKAAFQQLLVDCKVVVWSSLSVV